MFGAGEAGAVGPASPKKARQGLCCEADARFKKRQPELSTEARPTFIACAPSAFRDRRPSGECRGRRESTSPAPALLRTSTTTAKEPEEGKPVDVDPRLLFPAWATR